LVSTSFLLPWSFVLCWGRLVFVDHFWLSVLLYDL
jgi:hypothetical protein